jgi:hypothetical protein
LNCFANEIEYIAKYAQSGCYDIFVKLFSTNNVQLPISVLVVITKNFGMISEEKTVLSAVLTKEKECFKVTSIFL